MPTVKAIYFIFTEKQREEKTMTEEEEKDEIIKKLAKMSKTKDHELLIECLAQYNKIGLRYLSLKELKDFLKEKEEKNE